MKAEPLISLLHAVLAIGNVLAQNGEELTIPVETDNQFPPDYSESDSRNDGERITYVETPVLETTTESLLVTKIKDAIATTLLELEQQTTTTISNSNEADCPQSCVCTGDDASTVDCSGQDLTEFPSAIDPRTTTLLLQNNQLTSIPITISELKNLKNLNANDNMIMEIESGSLSELPELISLKLANNALSEYPRDLENGISFNKLEELDLGGNPINSELSALDFSNYNALRTLVLPEESTKLTIDLCNSLKSTLQTVGTENCKDVLQSDLRSSMENNLFDATIPGAIAFLPDLSESDTEISHDVLEKLAISELSDNPEILTTEETSSESTTFPESTEMDLDRKGNFEISPIPGVAVIPLREMKPDIPKITTTLSEGDFMYTQQTDESLNTSPVPALTETLFNTEPEEVPGIVLIPKVIDTTTSPEQNLSPTYTSSVQETYQTLSNLEEKEIPNTSTGIEGLNTLSNLVLAESLEIEIPEAVDVGTVFNSKEITTSTPEVFDTTATILKESLKTTTATILEQINDTRSTSELNSWTTADVITLTTGSEFSLSTEGTSGPTSAVPDIPNTSSTTTDTTTTADSTHTTLFSVTEIVTDAKTSSFDGEENSDTTPISNESEDKSRSSMVINESFEVLQVTDATESTLDIETKVTPSLSIIPETPFDFESKEIIDTPLISDVLLTSIDESLSSGTPVMPATPDMSEISPSIILKETTTTPSTLTTPKELSTVEVKEILNAPNSDILIEADRSVKTGTLNSDTVTTQEIDMTTILSDIKDTFEKPVSTTVLDASPTHKNDLTVDDFSLRTAVNNAPQEKIAVQEIITETPKEPAIATTDVKVGATTVTKAGGGVDKSVIAVIVAGMVVIVAIITIKKNWSSIKNRFSSTPRQNDRSGRHANGTTPEEVPLQDKSPV